jgi:RloB-like protein
MGRKASSFVRRPAKYKPQPRILILCEDKKSCRTYLQEAAQHFRCHAAVEIGHAGKTDPRGIVIAAKGRRADYDFVYCAVDRDAHETFDEAVSHAAKPPTVEVIPSHPCYEFWLLLHFRKTRSPFAPSGNHSAADNVTRSLRAEEGMSSYAKGQAEGLFEALLDRLPEARLRAEQVLADAVVDGELNPSTRLHELIAVFESLEKPLLLVGKGDEVGSRD